MITLKWFTDAADTLEMSRKFGRVKKYEVSKYRYAQPKDFQ
jgi:hypothetical protein